MSDCFATPWAVAYQAPLSIGFSRQAYWSGLPFPPPGDLPDPGIEPLSPSVPALQADSLPLHHLGSPGWLLLWIPNEKLFPSSSSHMPKISPGGLPLTPTLLHVLHVSSGGRLLCSECSINVPCQVTQEGHSVPDTWAEALKAGRAPPDQTPGWHRSPSQSPWSLRDSPSFRLPPASCPLRPLLLSPDYFPCLQLVPLPAARGGFLEGEGPWNTIQHECLGLPVVRVHKVTPSLAGKHLTPWCSARCAQLWMCAEHLVLPWGAGQALGIRWL